MASLRRNKSMPNDATSSRFLYTIMKQLDQKLIDWNLVAKELEITNGHAARMRFSRFRQHMEGEPSLSRKRAAGSSEPKAKRSKSVKGDEKKPKAERTAKADPGAIDIKPNLGANRIKADPGASDLETASASPKVKREGFVKNEPEESLTVVSLAGTDGVSRMNDLQPKQVATRVKAEPELELATESLPFENVIDPALSEYVSPSSSRSPERRIKKEERLRPTFTFTQFASPEVESQSPYPGLPFLESLSTPEGM